MNFKRNHLISRGMNLKRGSYDFNRDPHDCKRDDDMNLKGSHPSEPSQPAKKKKKNIYIYIYIIPGEQTFYVIRHSGSCWTTPFEI